MEGNRRDEYKKYRWRRQKLVHDKVRVENMVLYYYDESATAVSAVACPQKTGTHKTHNVIIQATCTRAFICV